MANKVKVINTAPLFNRTFGAILDLVITVFVGLGIFLGISQIMSRADFVKKYKDDYYKVMVDSEIMKLDDKNNLVPYVFLQYEQYEERFVNLYKNYLPSLDDKFKNQDEYWYNVFIYGQDDVKGLYSEKELNGRYVLSKVYGKEMFEYRKDDKGNILPDLLALPISYHNDPLSKDTISNTERKRLVSYYYVSDSDLKENAIAKEYKYIYYYSLSELTSLPRITNDYNKFALYGTTLPLVIGVFIAFNIFYFIVPICFKNGETIGKLIMHTCLVNKLGYQYRRIQLVPRYLFMSLITVFVLYFAGFSILAVGILSFLLLGSFICTVFTKDHRCFHDYIAGTLVIDKRNSTWFKDINEEERMQKQVDEYELRMSGTLPVEERTNIIYSNPHLDDDENDEK